MLAKVSPAIIATIVLVAFKDQIFGTSGVKAPDAVVAPAKVRRVLSVPMRDFLRRASGWLEQLWQVGLAAPGDEAAVDRDDGAGDVAGVIGNQEADQARHLLRTTGALVGWAFYRWRLKGAVTWTASTVGSGWFVADIWKMWC